MMPNLTTVDNSPSMVMSPNNNHYISAHFGSNEMQAQPLASAKSAPTTKATKQTKVRRTRQPRDPKLSVARRNERERNRVKMVNEGFALLRQHLPLEDLQSLPGESPASPDGNSPDGSRGPKKFSKVETLRAAIQRIRMLEELISSTEPLVDSGESQEQQQLFTVIDQQQELTRSSSSISSCTASSPATTATTSTWYNNHQVDIQQQQQQQFEQHNQMIKTEGSIQMQKMGEWYMPTTCESPESICSQQQQQSQPQQASHPVYGHQQQFEHHQQQQPSPVWYSANSPPDSGVQMTDVSATNHHNNATITHLKQETSASDSPFHLNLNHHNHMSHHHHQISLYSQ